MGRCYCDLRARFQLDSEKRASDEALLSATNETSNTFYKTNEEATVPQVSWSRPLFSILTLVVRSSHPTAKALLL